MIIQGEGYLGSILHWWFDLPWRVADYYRSTQKRSTCSIHTLSGEIMNELPQEYSAKCVYFWNVPEKCKIFSDDDDCNATSAAVSAIGDKGGRVAVFGDVNAEESTISTMVKLCTYPLRS